MATLQSREIHNRILLALSPRRRADILSECTYVEFPRRHMIYSTGEQVEYAYFINSGLVSLIKTVEDGRSAEVGAVSVDGLVGLFSVYGFRTALLDLVVQVPVTAWRINRATLQEEMSKHEALEKTIGGYLFLLVNQLAQIGACNRLHTLEQRCCHWLLVSHDSAQSNEYVLTHEFLALLLGAQRPSVSMTAYKLQQRGLIRYVHGHITILDRAAIEKAACECYRMNRAQIDQFFGSEALPRSA